MEKHQRSQSSKRASFPKPPPKGGSGGNENHQQFMELGRCGSISWGFIKTKDGSVPFIAIGTITDRPSIRLDISTGTVEEMLLKEINWDYLVNPKLTKASGEAGLIIFKKQYERFFKGIRRFPESEKAWRHFLTLDLARVAKDVALMGKIEMSTPTFKRIQKAFRRTEKIDDLDYLLANRYQAEGWNKLRMAEVGKICGKILKRKPFPATTIKDRTTALDLQTTLKPGAQPKFESLLAVQKHLLKRK
jgi:hypothetical protein